MDYQQTIDYLYHATPLFQHIGAGAYKEGLATTRTLDEHFGHPHSRYHTIHVAGTNGKGSVSSSLAAVLQSAGYRVGLYTSPHLVDFRERIRVDGEMIPEQRVVDFVEQERSFFEPLYPSFFELTTALAFLYFAEQQVDVAVVEVGLGGRLDCTNIIRPDLAVITNISFDHQQFLGNTLPAIAAEKAGIIKPGVPVVIGETNGHQNVRALFLSTFTTVNSATSSVSVPGSLPAEVCPLHGEVPSLRFADEESFPPVESELKGSYQRANLRTVQCALTELCRQPFYSRITPDSIARGLAQVMELTGFRGRWQQLREHPALVCDAGHNAAGIQYVVQQLSEQTAPHLHVIIGMVSDKDYHTAAAAFVHLAEARSARGLRTTFYLTQPSCARALPVTAFQGAFQVASQDVAQTASQAASQPAFSVLSFPSVAAALAAALSAAAPSDFIFVGGSCYVLADLFVALG